MATVQYSARSCWLIVWMWIIASPLQAQSKPALKGHDAFDKVTVKSGRTFRGLIVDKDSSGNLTMILSSPWLKSVNEKAHSTILKDNLEAQRASWKAIRDRIAERLNNHQMGANLVFFLKQEQSRIDQLLSEAAPSAPEFLWYEIRHGVISKVVGALETRKSIAAHAWNEQLANAESRDADSLHKELLERGVAIEGYPEGLSDRIPARPQTDQEWAARMALLEYTLVEPLDFQGTGEVMTRVREGEAADLGQILPQLLQQQLSQTLNELGSDLLAAPKGSGKTGWLSKTALEAEKLKHEGCRVTRLELDATGAQIKIESRFIVQTSKGRWQSIWGQTEAADGKQERPQTEARIAADPQLSSMKKSLESLGLSDAEAWKRAIRIGAATMASLQAVNAEFIGFRDRYTRHLDRPPLRFVD